MQISETPVKPAKPDVRHVAPTPLAAIELLDLGLSTQEPMPEWAVDYSRTFAGVSV